MNYSEKKHNASNEEKTTIKDYPEMNQGLPVQQVITDGEEPTPKWLSYHKVIIPLHSQL